MPRTFLQLAYEITTDIFYLDAIFNGERFHGSVKGGLEF